MTLKLSNLPFCPRAKAAGCFTAPTLHWGSVLRDVVITEACFFGELKEAYQLFAKLFRREVPSDFSWSTQPFAQAGHGSGGISHSEYRTIVAALIDANYSFTQFGHAEVLGELLETGWLVNDRLRTWASLMTKDTLDRDSISTLLAQLLIESKMHAPDDEALSAFHVAFAKAAAASNKLQVAHEDYERALAKVEVTITRNANRLLLPRLLLGSTYLTSVHQLIREHREVARRQVERIRKSLDNGGLWGDTPQTRRA